MSERLGQQAFVKSTKSAQKGETTAAAAALEEFHKWTAPEISSHTACTTTNADSLSDLIPLPNDASDFCSLHTNRGL